ncbi:hypothetical protein M3672_04625 [Microbacterium enclense]|uniref:FOG: TPR repeat, SEL1 subfamily n=1 Tax=Microbacterium enclense TaxID=993073 RepID=A0A1G6KEV8_9MICO|nr:MULTISPECIES: protealysin inhibitor emfourin [Microbacterium]KSU54125.1 hypothetical protein AS029_08450 [Microbacterium enclense]MCM3613722.1 hypothetical protein [Microbacterium enclense]SDC29388.1 hypothetical protein SAMN05216418_1952 [Microbacterium enclense]
MPQPDAESAERLTIIVVRSGGIAGLSKQWRAEADADHAPRWRELVESCPWDAASAPPSGADRYQWRIEVHHGGAPVHQARLGDGQVQGPWRTLVDEVRQAAPPARAAR